MKTVVDNIGLAERLVIKQILGEQNTLNKTVLFRVKRLRNKFKLRQLSHDVKEATDEEKQRLIDHEGFTQEQVKGIGLTWDALLEEGWHQPTPDKEETYGVSYDADIADIEWLLEQLENKKHWRLDENDEPINIEPALQEAIANVIISLENCISKDKKK